MAPRPDTCSSRSCRCASLKAVASENAPPILFRITRILLLLVSVMRHFPPANPANGPFFLSPCSWGCFSDESYCSDGTSVRSPMVPMFLHSTESRR